MSAMMCRGGGCLGSHGGCAAGVRARRDGVKGERRVRSPGEITGEDRSSGRRRKREYFRHSLHSGMRVRNITLTIR